MGCSWAAETARGMERVIVAAGRKRLQPIRRPRAARLSAHVHTARVTARPVPRSRAGEGEAREPVHVAMMHTFRPRLVYGVAGKASRKLLERHARLEPSERRAEAEV